MGADLTLRIAMLVPADEHGNAASHDVESGLLFLSQAAVLAPNWRGALLRVTAGEIVGALRIGTWEAFLRRASQQWRFRGRTTPRERRLGARGSMVTSWTFLLWWVPFLVHLMWGQMGVRGRCLWKCLWERWLVWDARKRWRGVGF